MGFKLNWSLDESLEQGWNNFGWVKKTKSENNYGVQNIPMSYSSQKHPKYYFLAKCMQSLTNHHLPKKFEKNYGAMLSAVSMPGIQFDAVWLLHDILKIY